MVLHGNLRTFAQRLLETWRLRQGRGRALRRTRRHVPGAVDALEARQLLTTLTVTRLNDAIGTG